MIMNMTGPTDHRLHTSFKGVIFDMDGTLTRTNELIFASFNHVTEKYCGRRFSAEEVIALFGPPEEGALSKVVAPASCNEAMDDLCAFYRANHRTMAGLHEGMTGVLEILRASQIPIAVFTGKGRRTATITLEEVGITSYVDLLVSGSDVVAYKPSPEGIHSIVEAWGMAASDVLMIGDAMPDLTAARAAGATPVAVLWDAYDRKRVLEAEPEFVFHRVDDLNRWLSASLSIRQRS
jgi:HAD superfamily hydrolase (TIGR01509 family)